jgi:hypothetical protein
LSGTEKLTDDLRFKNFEQILNFVIYLENSNQGLLDISESLGSRSLKEVRSVMKIGHIITAQVS